MTALILSACLLAEIFTSTKLILKWRARALEAEKQREQMTLLQQKTFNDLMFADEAVAAERRRVIALQAQVQAMSQR